ncbi:MAG: methylmalonyl-CoA mutase family protein [Bacteroidetes bacterium]|nr:methylmalonyl-CoA mutase family protein [Bacteroidota bacterium]
MNEPTKEKGLFSEFPPISAKEWEEVILADLKGADFEKKLIWKTDEGISLRPFYRSEDLTGLSHLDCLPGEKPYTRGNRVRTNQWEIRQDLFETDPARLNALVKVMIERGAGGIGIDASSLLSVNDIRLLFDQVDLTRAAIHFYRAASYNALLKIFLEYLEEVSTDPRLVKGSFNADPLSWLLLHGAFYQDWERNLRASAELIKTVRHSLPLFKALNINAHHFHNAGSSLSQELGFALSMACEYVSDLTDMGMKADEVLSSLMFTFAIGSDYFL